MHLQIINELTYNATVARDMEKEISISRHRTALDPNLRCIKTEIEKNKNIGVPDYKATELWKLEKENGDLGTVVSYIG